MLSSVTCNISSMPGQKQISAFFKPLATAASPKRSISSEDPVSVSAFMLGRRVEVILSLQERSIKKAKSDGCSESKVAFSVSDIERKRLMAKVKLQCRATPIVPADIGLSWFSALEPEFSKEYFTKASSTLHNPARNSFYLKKL